MYGVEMVDSISVSSDEDKDHGLSEKDISDDIFNALTKYFNTEEICNITFAVSQINTWTRLVRTFKLPAGNYKVQK